MLQPQTTYIQTCSLAGTVVVVSGNSVAYVFTDALQRGTNKFNKCRRWLGVLV
ncbi:MAG: hypothetical protein U5L09_09000 [Bacteroidales bacterium]|nr:hypothetical protein [Bacteroidales bacterium]